MTNQPNDLESRPITEQELLKYFLPVSSCTLWRWRRQRVDPLPHTQIGRRILYNLNDVKKWLAKQQRITMASRSKKTRTA